MRLIDAETLLLEVDVVDWCKCWRDDVLGERMLSESGVCKAICEAPTIDAVPVVRGKWIKGNTTLMVICGDKCMHLPAANCSVCKSPAPQMFKMNYCPNCGAKMYGGDK